MSFWNSLKIGASALTAQRLRLDVIANNVANAETTTTETGEPYQRKDVVFAEQNSNGFLTQLIKNLRGQSTVASSSMAGVKVASIETDEAEGALVYDPTHPDANEEGYVEYPNVNLVVEMTNMISATRSYEANLATIEAAKKMATKALEIGR
ncbi:MAG: flagellar basal body rod protein FlgC [Anaerolineales bacterium]|nr:flagellar basal body rod protein FlgC [Anaerolineales bacterium]